MILSAELKDIFILPKAVAARLNRSIGSFTEQLVSFEIAAKLDHMHFTSSGKRVSSTLIQENKQSMNVAKCKLHKAGSQTNIQPSCFQRKKKSFKEGSIVCTLPQDSSRQICTGYG